MAPNSTTCLDRSGEGGADREGRAIGPESCAAHAACRSPGRLRLRDCFDNVASSSLSATSKRSFSVPLTPPFLLRRTWSHSSAQRIEMPWAVSCSRLIQTTSSTTKDGSSFLGLSPRPFPEGYDTLPPVTSSDSRSAVRLPAYGPNAPNRVDRGAAFHCPI